MFWLVNGLCYMERMVLLFCCYRYNEVASVANDPLYHAASETAPQNQKPHGKSEQLAMLIRHNMEQCVRCQCRRFLRGFKVRLGIVAFTCRYHSIVPAVEILLCLMFPNFPADFCVEERHCFTLCETSSCIFVPKSFCFLVVVVANYL